MLRALRKLQGHFVENPDGTLTLDPGSGSPRVYTVSADVKSRYVIYSAVVLCLVMAVLLSAGALSLSRPGYTLIAIGAAIALICFFPRLNDMMLRLLFRDAIVAVHRKRRSRFWTEPLEDSEPEGFSRYYIRNALIVTGILFLIMAVPLAGAMVGGNTDAALILLLPAFIFGVVGWLLWSTLRRKWRLHRDDSGVKGS